MRLLLESAARKGACKANMEIAGKWATSGVPAEALAVRLVADQLKADIYIWAKSKDNGTWSLYGREARAKPRTKEMFLKLENQHYEWLQPKPDMGIAAQNELEKLLEDWRTKAWPYPGVGLKGRGGDDMDDVWSILGVECPPTSASRRPSCSSKDAKLPSDIASILGIGQDEEACGEEEPYTLGQVYTCPCGWCPDQGVAPKKRRQAARQHWVQCQGKPYEAQSSSSTRSAIGKWCRNGPRVKEQRREAYYQKWLEWRANLPCEVREGACVLDPASAETRPLKNYNTTKWRCAKCGVLRQPTQMPRVPCPARPSGITRASFLEATIGKIKARKALKAEAAKKKKLWKKQTPERKQQLKNNNKDYNKKPENKERRKVLNKYHYQNNKEEYLQKKRMQRRKFGKAAWKKLPSAEYKLKVKQEAAKLRAAKQKQKSL